MVQEVQTAWKSDARSLYLRWRRNIWLLIIHTKTEFLRKYKIGI